MKLETSLLILPPPQVQIFSAPLLAKYSPISFAQGPAHLTLFYPFVLPEDIEPTVTLLTKQCKLIDPIEVTLDQYGRFDSAHLLLPSDPTPIIALHQHLLKSFPEFPPYEGKYGNDLIPHLTLARFETKEEADQLQLPPVPTFQFVIDKLHLYLGPPDAKIAWIPMAIIPLGKPA